VSLRQERRIKQRATTFPRGLWGSAVFAWAIGFGIFGFFVNLKQPILPLGDARGTLASAIGYSALQTQLHSAVYAYVTGYNTVSSQTGGHPCIAASGANICGRQDAIACPRELRFGTVVSIRGRSYICEDHTAEKYNSRFDISCDKDANCPYQVVGWEIVTILPDSPSQVPVPIGTADLF
jgi:hypothetical protein